MKNKIILLGIMFGIVGCTNNSAKATAIPQQPQQYMVQNQLAGMPNWIMVPEVEGATAAVGSARIGKAGIQFARTKAMLNARAELARTIESKVKNLLKDYTNSVGMGDDETVESVTTNVSKAVANQTLKGSRQVDMFLAPNNELYVLVAVPNEDLKEDVKNQFKSDEKLYQEFKADQGFKELDAEIEKNL
ncbi:LPP20 family lipoprotein [Cetobacterium sp. SF1]|uniref:LPP20 family lipoprotein n=1 Tax=Cetobacterium sp. SF1 TaxID=3417654 RepID=UPI003CE92C0F